MEQKVEQAAAWIAKAEEETPARQFVVAEAVRRHDVSPVPEDFPHRARLLKSSMATLQQVHRSLRSGRINDIDGLGEKRIADIEQAVGHYDFEVLPEKEPVEEPNHPAFTEGTDDEDVPFD